MADVHPTGPVNNPSRTRKPPPAPACDNPVCRQPATGAHTFEVSQPEHGPWNLCSLACLVTWSRLWTVRLEHERQPDREEAGR